jgi:MoxR-like ATPase
LTDVTPPGFAPDFDRNQRFIRAVRERIATVVVGQEVVVERLLISLFTGGHILLQGVPGVAKTLLASALSKALDLDFARIQFTIDLLPSDIVGSEILDQRNNEFRTHRGPIFTHLLLADEINRAAPKVQSALLEAMQERTVTIANTTYSLPAPFLVIATQNPVEQSGTFELPEAQLDRFMLLHRLDYPTPDEERELLRRNTRLGVKKQDKGAIVQTEFDIVADEPVGSAEEIVSVMQAVPQVHVSETFLEHTVELVTRTPGTGTRGQPARRNCIDQSIARACLDSRPRLRRSRGHLCAGGGRCPPPAASALRGPRGRYNGQGSARGHTQCDGGHAFFAHRGSRGRRGPPRHGVPELKRKLGP